MISRRKMNVSLIGTAAVLAGRTVRAEAQAEAELDSVFTQLTYPSFDALNAPERFGLEIPNKAQREKAAEIIKDAPRGPTPYDIARSFVDKYYEKNPELISQWPLPAAWNPLIVEFFNATTLKVNNDMVHWCAAFANWCISRAGRISSNSAGSQSFLSTKVFKKVDAPKVGDLAIFTCYDQKSGKSLGLGHATFVREVPSNGKVKVTGGNQSKDGHSSIICDSEFPVGDRIVKRQLNGNYIATVMRLNSYIAII